ncbi:MAG: hypothetical protein ACTHJN_19270 [Ginsengibacter sp.]
MQDASTNHAKEVPLLTDKDKRFLDLLAQIFVTRILNEKNSSKELEVFQITSLATF